MSDSGQSPSRMQGAEPHHIPHGYVHPKEKHHWYWYGGFAAAGIVITLLSLLYWQYDHGAEPLCLRSVERTLTSPDEGFVLEAARVSCLGANRQLVVLHRANGGSHIMASFDGEAHLRIRWLSEGEAVIRRTGGRMWTLQPSWSGVHIKYR